jgi:hypothetical protein
MASGMLIADLIRRPGSVTPTSPIAASWSASNSGSDWPTRTGSVPPVLDTLTIAWGCPAAGADARRVMAAALELAAGAGPQLLLEVHDLVDVAELARPPG